MNNRTPLGQKLAARLQDMIHAIDSGKPMKQSVLRRMKVKGNTVIVRDTFTAPVKRKEGK